MLSTPNLKQQARSDTGVHGTKQSALTRTSLSIHEELKAKEMNDKIQRLWKGVEAAKEKTSRQGPPKQQKQQRRGSGKTNIQIQQQRRRSSTDLLVERLSEPKEVYTKSKKIEPKIVIKNTTQASVQNVGAGEEVSK